MNEITRFHQYSRVFDRCKISWRYLADIFNQSFSLRKVLRNPRMVCLHTCLISGSAFGYQGKPQAEKPQSNLFDDLFHQSGFMPIHDKHDEFPENVILENHPRYRPVFIDVIHYDIKVALDPITNELQGQVQIRFKSKIKDLKKIAFDIDSLQILGVSSDSPESKSLGTQLIYSTTPKLLEVELKEPLTRNEEGRLLIEYRASNPQSVYLSGPDATHPQRQIAAYTYTQPEDTPKWLPCIDRPDDKATANISIHYPSGYKGLSNGLLTSASANSMSYEMKEPIAPYLISLMIGPFEVADLGNYQGKPLTLWSPAPLMPRALHEARDTKLMMDIFSKFTGVEYPFSHYAQSIAESHGGSMEHQTATTMGGTRITGDSSGEGVIAHELAHQWFGDWVTCRTWGELWLNEGFASYLPFVFYEKKSDKLRLFGQLDSWRKSYFREAQKSPRALSESYPRVGEIFDAHSYDKGALVIHMIRDIVERNADNPQNSFTEVLKYYLTENARGNATHHDLQKALEITTGNSWQTFFDQWVLSPGHPQLAVSYQLESDGLGQKETPFNDNITDRLKVTIDQRQMDTSQWRSFTFPLEIELIDQDGSPSIHRVTLFDKVSNFLIPLNGRKIVGLNVNPRWNIPLEYELKQSLSGWKSILRHSEFASSRIMALRELDRLKAFEGDLFETHGREVMTLATNDPEPYVKIQALSILLEKLDPATQNDFVSINPSPFLTSIIQELMDSLRRVTLDTYQIKVALMRAQERLLTKQDPSTISEDAWQDRYLIAQTVGERNAILGILTHISRENAVTFMANRLQENHWSSQDRLDIVSRLIRIANPSSIKILGDILSTTSSSLFSRPILEQAIKDNWTFKSLIDPMVTLITHHSRDSDRKTALRWLGLQRDHQKEVCPILTEMLKDPEKYRAAGILPNIAETIRNMSCLGE